MCRFGQIQTLTLRVPLVPGVLQWQTNRTVVARAVLPVGDDLSGGGTVSHCKEKEGMARHKVQNVKMKYEHMKDGKIIDELSSVF